MKKPALVLAVVVCVFVIAAFGSYAEGKITERPEIKININGQIGTYSNVPILLNDRTLLPLVAILTNLGVENDGKHILWNRDERSITVYKGDTKIYLKLDSKTAYINDVPKEIDVAPITYQDRTYIPASFVALSLGKKVAWDGISNMVLIRDENEYNNIRSILEKVDAAMNAVEKYKTVSTGSVVLTVKGQTAKSSRIANSVTDNKNKTGYGTMESKMDLEGTVASSKLELFMKNNAGYVKLTPTGQWIKNDLSAEKANEAYIFDTFRNSNVLYAGLTAKDSTDGDMIVLKGQVNVNKFLQGYMEFEGFQQYTIDKADVEISIQKSSYLVKTMHLKVSGSSASLPGGAAFVTDIVDEYNDYNGNFEVIIPGDLP